MASKSSSTGNKQFQKKTPNKSGLTPVRPNKSPGNGMKLRSGLTPVRPEIFHGQQQLSKSPFKSPGSGLKKKSGLTPVRPGMQGSAKKSFNLSTDQHQQQKLKSGLLPIKPDKNLGQVTAGSDESMSFPSRRKSGLLPVRPNVFSLHHNDTSDPSRSNSSKPYSGFNTKSTGSCFDLVPRSATRRKSGLIPTKPGTVSSFHSSQQSWKMNSSVAKNNSGRTSQCSDAVFSSRLIKNTESLASLNIIDEDADESPRGNERNNLSGLKPLDDTMDGTVILRNRGTNLTSSRSTLSRPSSTSLICDSPNATVTRIPKRVLVFNEEDITTTQSHALKDGSSRMNVSAQQKQSSTSTQDSTTRADRIMLLNRRKIDLEEAMKAIAIEMKEINQELDQLKHVKEADKSAPENDLTDNESDSPFANVASSPTAAAPIELLPLDKAKRPENIYRMFRQSCSFLKTPQPSAFRKEYPQTQPAGVLQPTLSDGTPNISRRLQQQLALLFDE